MTRGNTCGMETHSCGIVFLTFQQGSIDQARSVECYLNTQTHLGVIKKVRVKIIRIVECFKGFPTLTRILDTSSLCFFYILFRFYFILFLYNMLLALVS